MYCYIQLQSTRRIFYYSKRNKEETVDLRLNSPRRFSLLFLKLFFALFFISYAAHAQVQRDNEAGNISNNTAILTAGFLGLNGVYNNELFAPYEVLQHTYSQGSSQYIRPFIVTPDGKPFTTFEGVQIIPDYSFENAPPIDILVIPSMKTSKTEVLENKTVIHWIAETQKNATYVMTFCWGAFPLAATGALNGRYATTFPYDNNKLAAMFPSVKIRRGVSFVVDGKYITSVGGHPSHESALYLVERLYSKKMARKIAKGMVMDWKLSNVKYFEKK